MLKMIKKKTGSELIAISSFFEKDFSGLIIANSENTKLINKEINNNQISSAFSKGGLIP